MTVNVPGAVIFAAFALALLAASVWTTYRAVRLRDWLRESFAVILFGFAGAMAYEAAALGTGHASSISHIVASEFPAHPLVWMAFFLPVIGMSGALTFHFLAYQHRARWWVFAAGAVVYLLGGIVAFEAGWLPT